jgi:plasmid stabilization system protein ParE
MKYQIAQAASHDLERVLDYLEQYSLDAGERFIREFNEKCRKLVEFPNGKKSQYVPVDKIVETQVMIERRKAITRLERQIVKVEQQLEAIARQSSHRATSLEGRTLQFGDRVEFMLRWETHQLVADGVVMAVAGDQVTLAYRCFVPGQGDMTGTMTIAIGLV